MEIELKYMTGAGNLFCVVDNSSGNVKIENCPEIAVKLCQNKGYETEGLIVVNKGKPDFSVWFFNPDGSSGMMCGNGGRCAVRFAFDHEFTKSKTPVFEMAGVMYSAIIHDNGLISLFLPKPVEIKKNIYIDIDGKVLYGDYVNVGSDHFVLDFAENFIDSINAFAGFDIYFYGIGIRRHNFFVPKGTNANFYFCAEDGNIYLRTYERGVEAETGACGTGAVSTALSAVLAGKASFPVHIIPSSGMSLWVDIKGGFPAHIEKIELKGPAEYYGSNYFNV